MPHAHELIRDAVFRHRILWKDVAKHIEEVGGIPASEAQSMVAACIAGRGCTVAVAAAAIDLISQRCDRDSSTPPRNTQEKA